MAGNVSQGVSKVNAVKSKHCVTERRQMWSQSLRGCLFLGSHPSFATPLSALCFAWLTPGLPKNRQAASAPGSACPAADKSLLWVVRGIYRLREKMRGRSDVSAGGGRNALSRDARKGGMAFGAHEPPRTRRQPRPCRANPHCGGAPTNAALKGGIPESVSSRSTAGNTRRLAT